MSKLRIVLSVQLLFFFGWGAFLLYSRNAPTREFYLETEPVDPRDMLAGTYVALRYPIATPRADSCTQMMSAATGTDFYVKLDNRGRTIFTPKGPLSVYEDTDCAQSPTADYGWVRASRLDSAFPSGSPSVQYGIEKFYLNENDPRKTASSGSVLAKVKIGPDHRLVLIDLVSKNN